MKKKISLTGIKPTGDLHLGNYIGAIKPALKIAESSEYTPIYFIADYHALTNVTSPGILNEWIYKLAAGWIALGLDPDKVIFYKQSDVGEIFELSWILSCYTPKGIMNRAHAYKSKSEENIQKNQDKDYDINMGLYTYPILMAADILLFNSDLVPIGQDQIQHIEIARDLAMRFNNAYGDTFTLPNYLIKEGVNVIPGLDGRKMSKSYNNTIPLFSNEKQLHKLIKKFKTNSQGPEEPKDTEFCNLFKLYKEFATEIEIEKMKNLYANGIGWGQVKEIVFEKINNTLNEPREHYNEILSDKNYIDNILKQGAEKAKEIAYQNLTKIKSKL